ncbi:transposase [Endozoicomonas sp. SCSIO W0465]|uniref:transposase n=1 Tax=Endozoicomonas sp. SCSIO W0465 TaxID=2918516 RepID=UPI00207553B8|nr:transposase [Endozoicomonas sp. SCSIO W0465]USE34930.1 transposase [Endozoicomonas sp. SCSIO W0465]
MDETSSACGYDYITLFVDLEEKRTVLVTDGKGSETVKAFTAELEERNGKTENMKGSFRVTDCSAMKIGQRP